MKPFVKSLGEGFFGSFALAGALVMAIVSVATAFVNGSGTPTADPEKQGSRHAGK